MSNALATFANADCRHLGSRTAPIVAIGDALNLETLATARGIIDCDDWARAEYRMPCGGCAPLDVACNIIVTGRSNQYRNGSAWVRVRIEWPDEDKATTSCKGWARVN